jgi:2,3-bisphosphoglycerate-dependent phosphoglycerate mutase
MILYIIRHAQSSNNALLDGAQRVCDPWLTELGHRQVELLAQHLTGGVEPPAEGMAPSTTGQGYAISRLYTSPMRRAIQTARVVGRALGLDPEVWIDIHEHGGIYLDHGAERGLVGYPGMTRDEMLALCPDLVLPAGVTDVGWWTGCHEEWSGCVTRAGGVAAALRLWAARDERVALVTHGAFIDALLKILLDEAPDWETHYYLHYNTAISRLDWVGESRPEVRDLARVDHLPAGLIS